MGACTIKIGQPRWTKETNHATAVSNAGGAVTSGVLVPKNFRGEAAYLSVTKNATCTLKVYGMTNYSTSEVNLWQLIDTYSFTEAATPNSQGEAVMVRGASAFDRVATSINAIGSNGALNIYWGFTE